MGFYIAEIIEFVEENQLYSDGSHSPFICLPKGMLSLGKKPACLNFLFMKSKGENFA